MMTTMSVAAYRQVLVLPGVLRLLVFGVLARMPRAASGVILTLYVVLGTGRGYAAAGLVGTAYTVGAAIGSPWRGRAVDRFGLRRALIPSVVCEALTWTAIPFVGYHLLLVVAFVGGLMAVPIFNAIRQSLAVMVPGEHQHSAYALDSIGTEVSFMAGPVVAVLLVTQWSARGSVFLAGGTLALAGLGLIAFNPPTRNPENPENPESQEPENGTDGQTPRRSLLRDPALLVVLTAGAATVAVLAGTDVSIVAFTRAHHEVDLAWVVFLVWPLASLVGGLVYGAVPRSVSAYGLLLGLGLLTVPAGLAANTMWLAVAVIPAGLLCAPAMSANVAAISRLVPEARRGEAMGWYGSSLTLGIAAGTPLAGSAIDLIAPWAGFALLGGIGSGVALTALVLIRWGTDRPGSIESGAPSGVSPTRRLAASPDQVHVEPNRTTAI
jgi:MFS family permease